MNNEEGKIWYGLGIDTRGLERDANKAASIFRGIGTQAASDCAKMDSGVNALAASIARLGATALSGAAVAAFGKQIINVRGEMQLLEQSFEVLTGSAEKSKTMLSDIIGLATDSPLEMQPVAKAAQTLMGFGVETENVMGILRQLSDVSMGNQQRFESLALVYAQTQSAGKLMGQDLLQYINAGFNPLQIIAEQTGKSMAVLKEEMSEGAISAKMVADAFTSATSEGGKFYDMTKKQADTIVGVRATFEDSITQMFNNIGKDSEEFIKGGYEMATSLVQNYETIGRALASLIATYGTYKAAVLVATTVEKLRYQATLAQMAGMTKMQAIMDVLRAKTAALNKTMLANPYVLLATAVVAVGAALWMLSDNTDKVAKKMEEFNEKQDKIRSDTEGLVGIIQSETTTMYQKIKAYDELIAKSDALAKAYTLEKLMSGEVTQSEIGVILNKQREADEYKELIKIRNEAQKIYTELSSSPEGGFNVYGITEAKRDLDGANKAIDEYNSRVAKAQQIAKNGVRLEGVEENITLLTKETSTIDERTTAYEKLKELSPELASMYDQEAISLMSLAQAQEAASRAEQIATLRKEKMTNEGVISNMEGNALSGSYMGNPLQGVIDDIKLKNSSIDQQIADLLNKPLPTTTTGGGDGSPLAGTIKAYEEDNKRLKKLQEETTKNSEQFATYQKQIDANNLKISQINGAKQSEATLKAQEDAHNSEMELKRSQISDKLELIRFDRDRELAEIEKNRQAYLKAGGSKGDDGDKAFQKQKQVVRLSADNEINALNTENQKAEALAMQNYLKEYGTFQQRKLAITQEYAAKIAKVEEGSAQALLLAKERDSALADVETEAIKMQIDWQTVFGNVGGLLSDAVKPTLEEAKKYLNTDEFKNASEDSKQVLIEAIQQLEASIGSSGGLNFKQLGEDVNAYQESLRNLMDAKQAEIDAYDDLAKAQKAYEEALRDGTDAEIESTESALETAQINAETASSNVESATASSKVAQDKMRETAEDTQNKMSVVTDSIQKFSTGGLKNAFEGITGLMKALGGTESAAGKLAEQLDIPLISWILSLIDALQDGIGPIISGLIDSIFGAINGILSNIFSGDIFVQIGKSIWEGLAGLFNSIFTLGGTFNWTSAESDPDLAEDRDRLIASNDNLVDALNDLTDKIAEEAVSDAETNAANAEANILTQMSQTQELMQREGAAYKGGTGGTHSSNHYINEGMSSTDWSAISAAAGRSVNSAAEFWTLSSEEMANVKANAESAYSKLEGLANDGYSDASQYMDGYTELYEQLEEIENMKLEKQTGISFDSLKDDFKSVLLDMESDAQDFADQFEAMMQEAVINSMSDKYTEKLNDWYKDFAEANSDGEITAEEQAKLQEQYDKITADALAERNALMESMGWTTDSDSEREASSSGIATASQESVDENNGRLTVIQSHTYGLLERVTDLSNYIMGGNFSTGSDKVIGSADTSTDYGALLYKVNSDMLDCLYGIKDDTANLTEIKSEMTSMRKGIETLNKGVYLKR